MNYCDKNCSVSFYLASESKIAINWQVSSNIHFTIFINNFIFSFILIGHLLGLKNKFGKESTGLSIFIRCLTVFSHATCHPIIFTIMFWVNIIYSQSNLLIHPKRWIVLCVLSNKAGICIVRKVDQKFCSPRFLA